MNKAPATTPPRESNLFGLDYRAEAAKMPRLPYSIIDVHSHINGERAAAVYREARALYGVGLTYSMTQMPQAQGVQRILGDTIRFIAVPDYSNKDRAFAHGEGYIDTISKWHAIGARMVKFWVAPRGRDLGRESGDWRILTLENPWRRRQMDHAASLGMMFMCHVADPDTWFKTKYTDAALYGTKRQQYEPLEPLLRDYRRVPWILAHMGGWPEDLDFLSGLLERHENLHLDTSATKWMVRELSRHPTDRLLTFFERWRGRILFGSDIVTNDGHVGGTPTPGPPTPSAGSIDEAFDLYASRYWALRTMYESRGDRPSPIADPDLAMVEPDRFTPLSSPTLRGHALPPDLLRIVYHDAAANLVNKWWDEHR